MIRHPRAAGALKVFLIVLGVLAAIVIALGIWIALSWRGWAATGVHNTVATMVQQSQLPPEQRTLVLQRVDELARDFEQGKVTLAQVSSIADTLAKGPLMQAGLAWATHERFIALSLLNDAEKADAKLHLQRLARGISEGTIPQSALDDVLAPIATRDANGQWQPKGQPSLEATQSLVARIKAKADAASIPVEPFNFDIVGELDKAIAAAKAQPTK